MTANIASEDATVKKGAYFYEAFDTEDDALPRYKVGCFTLPNTTTSSDTATIDLYKKFGITKPLLVKFYQHTTENSVIVDESESTVSTISMQNNTMSIAVNGSSSAAKRLCLVYGI